MNQPKNYFMLFACCIPVKGATRSIICDLQRASYKYIPNGLYDILTNFKKKSVVEIKAIFNNEFDDVIDEYFDFLTRNEFGIWREQFDDAFFAIDMKWKRPELITNAILDFNQHSDYNYATVLSQLEDLSCKALQLRFFSDFELNSIEAVIKLTEFSKLRSIEVFVKYNEQLSSEESLKQLSLKHPRLSYIVVHSAPLESSSFYEFTKTTLVFTKQKIDSASHCGVVNSQYFTLNIETFTEGQNFNTCLNKKISVDVNGNIKNCPSMEVSFGNIQETSLHEALIQKDFKKLWDINKDQIETCKDCEFRYICTDCRAFISKPENVYSKPSKCTYDPYTGRWKTPAAPVNVESEIEAVRHLKLTIK